MAAAAGCSMLAVDSGELHEKQLLKYIVEGVSSSYGAISLLASKIISMSLPISTCFVASVNN